MSLYRMEYRLLDADVDRDRRLRWSRLFAMFEQASLAHFSQLGAGADQTQPRGLCWIIALQRADIRRLPEYGEQITLSSWSGKTAYMLFPRYYRMHDQTGALLLEGSALWGLMDAKTRTLAFPQQHGISVPAHLTGDDPPLPRTLRGVEPTERHRFRVPYSYLDLNGHMNNTRYFDLVQDLLPSEALRETPRSIRIEYCAEALWHDELTVGAAKTETGWFFRGDTNRRIFCMALEY